MYFGAKNSIKLRRIIPTEKFLSSDLNCYYKSVTVINKIFAITLKSFIEISYFIVAN